MTLATETPASSCMRRLSSNSPRGCGRSNSSPRPTTTVWITACRLESRAGGVRRADSCSAKIAAVEGDASDLVTELETRVPRDWKRQRHAAADSVNALIAAQQRRVSTRRYELFEIALAATSQRRGRKEVRSYGGLQRVVNRLLCIRSPAARRYFTELHTFAGGKRSDPSTSLVELSQFVPPVACPDTGFEPERAEAAFSITPG